MSTSSKTTQTIKTLRTMPTKPKAAKDMALSDMEKDALDGLNARAALVQLQYETAMKDVQARGDRIFGGISARLELPDGAFGADGAYDVDPQAWTVRERPKPQEPAVAPEAAAPSEPAISTATNEAAAD